MPRERRFRFGRRRSDNQPFPKDALSLQFAISDLVPTKARIVRAFYRQIFEAQTLDRLVQLSNLVIASNLTAAEKDPLLKAIDGRYGELTAALVGPRRFTITSGRGAK